MNNIGRQTKKAKHTTKIVVYGGNGFVGTRVARALLARDVCAVCLSRSGHKPLHLGDQQWSESVRWCKGDASEPDTQLLQRLDGLVTLVGSPPLPSFSKEAYDEQVFANGTTNANAIKGAGEAGIKRVVLLGAQLPFFMRGENFGYAQGKKIAMQAAQDFSELSSEHRAIVIQPGLIYGRRYQKNGKSIPLDIIFKPISRIMPWQFVSVEKVAERVASEMLCNDSGRGQFIVIKNSQI
ncbi:MAG: NAD(P)-dependent oxidoreductase [Arenicella sp.]|nr:NAD(P)-dependent oxidoreductase [Arenicella sp.]